MSSTGTAWIRIWGLNLPPASRWPFLYDGWDGGWFINIAKSGYWRPANYAFFPGYPITIYLYNLVINNTWASAALSSMIFGVAWIPFFQAVAEHYLTRETALRATLIAAFFPYVFLFTTVAYSEPLFLFACVASWYFYLKNKNLDASLLAAVATITRVVGIIIVLPMFLDMLHKRAYKSILYLLIPVSALLAWLSYCFVNTGNWLAFISAENTYWSANQQHTFLKFLVNLGSISNWTVNSILHAAGLSFFNLLMGLILIVLASILIYYGRKVDWRLTIYSVASFLFLLVIYYGRKVDWRLTIYSVASFLFLLFFGSLLSISRYLSFIFPFWIALGSRTLQGKWRNVLTATLCVLFFSIAFLLWYEFLSGEWVA